MIALKSRKLIILSTIKRKIQPQSQELSSNKKLSAVTPKADNTKISVIYEALLCQLIV